MSIYFEAVSDNGITTLNDSDRKITLLRRGTIYSLCKTKAFTDNFSSLKGVKSANASSKPILGAARFEYTLREGEYFVAIKPIVDTDVYIAQATSVNGCEISIINANSSKTIGKLMTLIEIYVFGESEYCPPCSNGIQLFNQNGVEIFNSGQLLLNINGIFSSNEIGTSSLPWSIYVNGKQYLEEKELIHVMENFGLSFSSVTYVYYYHVFEGFDNSKVLAFSLMNFSLGEGGLDEIKKYVFCFGNGSANKIITCRGNILS